MTLTWVGGNGTINRHLLQPAMCPPTLANVHFVPRVCTLIVPHNSTDDGAMASIDATDCILDSTGGVAKDWYAYHSRDCLRSSSTAISLTEVHRMSVSLVDEVPKGHSHQSPGQDKASFTSLVAALGINPIPPSPNGMALIPRISFIQFQTMPATN